MEYRITDSSQLQMCPAAVDVDTGIILINRDVWNHYDKLQQQFIIEHEIAHYLHPEYSEIEADRVALHKIAGKTKHSLRRALSALFKVGVKDETRLEALYMEALRIDAKHGNKEAAEELERIEGMDENADGVDVAEEFTVKNRRNNMETITICGYEISITNILLIGILFLMLNKQ